LTIWTSAVLFKFVEFFQLYIPALILDASRYVNGKKPKFVKFYKHAQKLLQVTEYFRMNEWEFQTMNMVKLFNTMSEADQDVFNFQVQDINFIRYMESSYGFIRNHIFKEDKTSLEKARARMKILKVANSSLKILGIVFTAFAILFFIRSYFTHHIFVWC